jgi:hypothetical protein
MPFNEIWAKLVPVDKRTENPRVGRAVPPLATIRFQSIIEICGYSGIPLREFPDDH